MKGASLAVFWGKISALKNDYYVVQAQVEGGEEGDLPPNVEAKGTGVNEKVYFVTINLMDENGWVELPTITPNQIIQARRIRHVMTGDLDYKIQTCPKFDGKEKEYLKAQIVRISRSCSIFPNNKFQVKKDDDEGADQNPQEIEPFEDENPPKFTYNEMVDMNCWQHSERGILNEGRIVHMEVEPEEESGEDKEVLMKRIVAGDPFEIRLKSITQDRCSGLDKCWVLRKIGDGTHYAHQYKEGALVHNTIVNLRSLVWPGMNHVCKDGRVISLYLGNGLKYTQNEFFPKFPYTIQCEPADRVEENEPDQDDLQEVAGNEGDNENQEGDGAE